KMKNEIKVLAVNIQNKPEEIPDEFWIKYETFYTLEDAEEHSNGTVIYYLKEIDLESQKIKAKNGRIWKGFNANRFAIDLTQLQDIKDLIETKAPLKELGLHVEKPLSELMIDLSKAVANEDYESAAEIRDRIKLKYK